MSTINTDMISEARSTFDMTDEDDAQMDPVPLSITSEMVYPVETSIGPHENLLFFTRMYPNDQKKHRLSMISFFYV